MISLLNLSPPFLGVLRGTSECAPWRIESSSSLSPARKLDSKFTGSENLFVMSLSSSSSFSMTRVSWLLARWPLTNPRFLLGRRWAPSPHLLMLFEHLPPHCFLVLIVYLLAQIRQLGHLRNRLVLSAALLIRCAQGQARFRWAQVAQLVLLQNLLVLFMAAFMALSILASGVEPLFLIELFFREARTLLDRITKLQSLVLFLEVILG